MLLDMCRSQTVLSHLMQFVPWRAFSRNVARYHGERNARTSLAP